jgi:hypothetical protein
VIPADPNSHFKLPAELLFNEFSQGSLVNSRLFAIKIRSQTRASIGAGGASEICFTVSNLAGPGGNKNQDTNRYTSGVECVELANRV